MHLTTALKYSNDCQTLGEKKVNQQPNADFNTHLETERLSKLRIDTNKCHKTMRCENFAPYRESTFFLRTHRIFTKRHE